MRSGDIVQQIGFIANDWIFFTKCTIGLGERETISSNWSYDSVYRGVISGGVKEYANMSFSDKEVERLYASDNLIFRFEDEDKEKSRDHTVTPEEKENIKIMEDLKQLNNVLFRAKHFWGIIYSE